MSAKPAPRRTRRLLIQQEALRLFAQRHPEAEQLDLVDAALLDHVSARLGYRKHQRRAELEGGEPVVWVHYPTIAAENWLLRLGPDALGKRFARLVKAGLLVRKQLPRRPGEHSGGSQAYYGLSRAWREALEHQETAPSAEADENTPRQYEADQNMPRRGVA